MRKHISFWLFLTGAIAFAGCKASTSANATTTTPGSMIATVNDSAWSTAVIPNENRGSAAARRTISGYVVTGEGFVTGEDTDITEITFVLLNPKIGSVSLGSTSVDFGEYSQGVVPDTSTAYITFPTSLTQPSSGSVTITQFDTVNCYISGQFDFVGRKANNLSDTVVITGGSFYQVGWAK